ncbi:hypothetical protein E6R18_24845 [Streptomyces sp. A1277]|uniref:hypothetical protein n=1 Tax=Streptomyces sp. A1277 TaxID=2563103 RepID=UPI0010A27883|nr:hypothetical protein [Streptomyces sp. A1277]THA29142.1 hypothetical protein E6R18_24845 [Streptomyces sp. A1277]
MSKDSSTTKVNSELPDEDALGAFAANAFGPTRRSRRAKHISEDDGGTRQAPQVVAPTPSVEAAPEVTAEAAPDTTPAPVEPDSFTETGPETMLPEAQPTPAQHAVSAAIPAPALPELADTARTQIKVRTLAPPPPARIPTRAETGQVQIPNLGPEGSRATQCTIMVSGSVRDRIAQYQLSKKTETGKEPTNSVVVRRAFLNARRHNLFRTLLAAVHHRQNPVEEEDYDDDGLLGEVVGRRVERGRMKDSQQQSFRPSYQELATYDAFSTAYGFPSRSDFLDACLDEFLPSKATPARRNR